MTEELITDPGQEGISASLHPPQKNFLRDLFGIIFDPTNAFKNIIAIGYWIMLVIIMMLAAGLIEQSFHNQLINLTIQKMQEKAGENVQQIQGAISFYQNPAITRPLYFVFTAAGQIVYLLILTILYFFASSVLFGGTAKFKQVWVVSCWAYIIILLGMLLKAPLVIAKNSMEAGLNLGLLFTENIVGPKMHSFFTAVDIFGIWHFIVMGIGLATLYKFTVKKSIGISFVIWLLMALVGGISAYISA